MSNIQDLAYILKNINNTEKNGNQIKYSQIDPFIAQINQQQKTTYEDFCSVITEILTDDEATQNQKINSIRFLSSCLLQGQISFLEYFQDHYLIQILQEWLIQYTNVKNQEQVGIHFFNDSDQQTKQDKQNGNLLFMILLETFKLISEQYPHRIHTKVESAYKNLINLHQNNNNYLPFSYCQISKEAIQQFRQALHQQGYKSKTVSIEETLLKQNSDFIQKICNSLSQNILSEGQIKEFYNQLNLFNIQFAEKTNEKQEQVASICQQNNQIIQIIEQYRNPLNIQQKLLQFFEHKSKQRKQPSTIYEENSENNEDNIKQKENRFKSVLNQMFECEKSRISTLRSIQDMEKSHSQSRFQDISRSKVQIFKGVTKEEHNIALYKQLEEIQALQKDVSMKNQEISEYKNVIKMQNSEIKDLQEQNHNLQQQIDKMQQQVELFAGKHDKQELLNQVDLLNDKAFEQKSRIQELCVQLARYEKFDEKIELVENENIELKETNSQLQHKIKDLKKLNEGVKYTIQLEELVQDLKEQNRQLYEENQKTFECQKSIFLQKQQLENILECMQEKMISLENDRDNQFLMENKIKQTTYQSNQFCQGKDQKMQQEQINKEHIQKQTILLSELNEYKDKYNQLLNKQAQQIQTKNNKPTSLQKISFEINNQNPFHFNQDELSNDRVPQNYPQFTENSLKNDMLQQQSEYYQEFNKNFTMNSLTNLSKENQQLYKFKRASLKNNFPLFKNSELLIGMISSLNQEKQGLEIQLYYTNKCENPLKNFNIHFNGGNNNVIELHPLNVSSTLPKGAQLKQTLFIQFLEIPFEIISAKLSYTMNEIQIQEEFQVPNTINKYMSYQEVDFQKYEILWNENVEFVKRTEPVNLDKQIAKNSKEILAYFKGFKEIRPDEIVGDLYFKELNCTFLMKIIVISDQQIIFYGIASNKMFEDYLQCIIQTFEMLFGEI